MPPYIIGYKKPPLEAIDPLFDNVDDGGPFDHNYFKDTWPPSIIIYHYLILFGGL